MLKIVENAANLVGTDTSAIYFVKGNDLFLEATFPASCRIPGRIRYAKLDNHPYIRAVIESRTTIIVNDVSKATLTEEERLITRIRNLGSLVYIPLLVQKKVEGVIILGTIGRIHEFEQVEIDLFSTFSNITSLALENSYLFGNLRIAMEKAEEVTTSKPLFCIIYLMKSEHL
ncbi:MAG: GAF domain-containing protein [Marinilabiliales bacterium]|nr:GAF domain-containing protein [Marinilabiliales bacterium]